VDLKSADDSFYTDLCGGHVAPVQEALRIFRATTHIEVTKLLVTGHVDPVEDAGNVASWIASELGRDVPLHLSRYFPRHQWSSPETPGAVLHDAFRRARELLDYVYVGNAILDEGANTLCPGCRSVLVEREPFYRTRLAGLRTDATCARCGRSVPIRGVSEG
jgi:pyruvate formate lyase activating enzyme